MDISRKDARSCRSGAVLELRTTSNEGSLETVGFSTLRAAERIWRGLGWDGVAPRSVLVSALVCVIRHRSSWRTRSEYALAQYCPLCRDGRLRDHPWVDGWRENCADKVTDIGNITEIQAALQTDRGMDRRTDRLVDTHCPKGAKEGEGREERGRPRFSECPSRGPRLRR